MPLDTAINNVGEYYSAHWLGRLAMRADTSDLADQLCTIDE